jgi:hypothetical protein
MVWASSRFFGHIIGDWLDGCLCRGLDADLLWQRLGEQQQQQSSAVVLGTDGSLTLSVRVV